MMSLMIWTEHVCNQEDLREMATKKQTKQDQKETADIYWKQYEKTARRNQRAGDSEEIT